MADGFYLEVDVKSLARALRKVDGDISDLKEGHKQAAEVVKAEWQRRASPYRDSGAFIGGGFAKGLQGKGYVDVVKKGPPYAGVSEFGGTIPRFHSKRRTLHKKPIGGPGGTSYFLYPALDAKLDEVRDVIMRSVDQVMLKNGLKD